jgi:hypothetical protein
MSESDEDRVDLSVEDALAALAVRTATDEDGTTQQVVHCIMPAGPLLLGADWSLDRVRQLFEADGAEVAGQNALRMFHGVSVRDEGESKFFATREDWQPPAESTRVRVRKP